MNSCTSPDRCWRHSNIGKAAGKRIHVANPRCPADVLTDRWPASMGEQAQFIEDLRNLVKEVERLAARGTRLSAA